MNNSKPNTFKENYWRQVIPAESGWYTIHCAIDDDGLKPNERIYNRIMFWAVVDKERRGEVTSKMIPLCKDVVGRIKVIDTFSGNFVNIDYVPNEYRLRFTRVLDKESTNE